jgi:outer membrane protein
MQNFRIIFRIIIFSIFFFSNSSFGADVAKIGVVDFQRIFETSNAGKLAQSEINEHGKKMEADLKKKGAEIGELQKKLEREILVISKEVREERERELRIKTNDFKFLNKKYLRKFKEIEQKIVKRIKNDVLEIVEEIGKKEGYLIVFEKRDAGVLYSPSTIDITDKLIQKYNAKFAQ